MKMVKKVLMGLAVIAMAFSFVGCMPPEDDDKNIIKGSNGSYSVDYTFEEAENTSDTYRAYKSTALKHAGALVRITYDSISEMGASKMGVIFGLKEEKKGDITLKNFNIIGVGTTATNNYYVSTMTDIEDIQANNFGASTTAKAGDPKEVEWVPLNGANMTLPTAVDGKITVYVWYQATKDGDYKWAILDMTSDQAKAWKNMSKENKEKENIPTATKVLASGTIEDAFTLGTNGKIPESPISIYAMVKGYKTLNAEVKVEGTYLEAEDAE